MTPLRMAARAIFAIHAAIFVLTAIVALDEKVMLTQVSPMLAFSCVVLTSVATVASSWLVQALDATESPKAGPQ